MNPSRYLSFQLFLVAAVSLMSCALASVQKDTFELPQESYCFPMRGVGIDSMNILVISHNHSGNDSAGYYVKFRTSTPDLSRSVRVSINLKDTACVPFYVKGKIDGYLSVKRFNKDSVELLFKNEAGIEKNKMMFARITTTIEPVEEVRINEQNPEVSFQYLRFIGKGNNNLADSLSRQIEQSFTSPKVKNAQEFVNRLKHDYYDCSMEIAFWDEEVISIETKYSIENMGQMHSQEGIHYRNFDVLTGEKIHVDNLIDPAKKKDFLAFFRNRLYSENDFKPDRLFPFKQPENFYFRPNGITFVYSNYEIAAHSYGVVQQFCSFDELRPFLNLKNPIVNRVLKK